MYSTGGIVKVISKPDDNTCAECRKNSLQYWDVDSWVKHSNVYGFGGWNFFSGENCILKINSKRWGQMAPTHEESSL